jgi:hypothetical protein
VANIVHNVALGREREFVDRVNNNDPSTSGILWIPVLASGLETDATLKDKTTITDYFSGATDEATGSNWNRKTHTDTSGLTVTVTHGSDVLNIDAPDLVWTPGPSAGNAGKLLGAYKADTGAADSTGIPIVSLDFTVTVDGNQVTFQFHANGFVQIT